MADLHAPVTAEDHVRGEPDAPLTLIEYGDFQCPHCRIAHALVQRLQRHFGKRLRFVYRHFPLVEIHPMAEPAAEAAEFAGEKRKFWPMYDAIFDGQERLTPEMLAQTAESLGLDAEDAAAAIEDQPFLDRIERDINSGERAGVHGTPTFFINGRHYQGTWDYDELRDALEAAA